MSATSVLQLAEAAPGRYRSIGSFSGCDQISAGPCAAVIRLVLGLPNARIDNMWGPVDGPLWRAHDPTTPVNLEKLRGVNVVIAAGNGAAGPHDNAQATDSDLAQLARQLVSGGGLEAGVAFYTRQLQETMARLDVPATFLFPATGTHSWLYWQDDLHLAWPSFARSLGLSPAASGAGSPARANSGAR
jgi:S-formylglutathione hydrolase FrmB